MSDATDKVVNPATSSPDVTKFDYRPENPPIVPIRIDTRTSQQELLPNSVQVRQIGSLFSDVPNTVNLGVAIFSTSVIPNSSTGVFNFTVADNAGRQIIAPADWSAYIGSVSAANQWPTSFPGGVGAGGMPIYATLSDFGMSNNLNVVTRIIVRNNTGSTQTVIVAVRWRIVTFPITQNVITN